MSVQETVENALSKILQEKIELTGCGRTDAGVHAKNYVAHFDAEKLPNPSDRSSGRETFLAGANSLLPPGIVLHQFWPVAADAHARFDAVERQYEYHLVFERDPFRQHTAWYFPQGKNLDFEKLQAVADLLPPRRDFFTFCKTHSGLAGFDCEIRRSEWQKTDGGLVFHISANRFLRGMVRLIVGACVNVGLGKVEISDVEFALDHHQILKKNLSVPPEGLFLTQIIYHKDTKGT